MGRGVVGDRFAGSGAGHEQAVCRYATFGQVIGDSLCAVEAQLPVPRLRTRAIRVTRDRKHIAAAVVREIDEPVQYGEGRRPDLGARLPKRDWPRNSVCEVSAAERRQWGGRSDDKHILPNRHSGVGALAQETEARSQQGRIGGHSANLDFPRAQSRLCRIQRANGIQKLQARGFPAIRQQDTGIESGFCLRIRELFCGDLPEPRFVLARGGCSLEQQPAGSMPKRQ